MQQVREMEVHGGNVMFSFISMHFVSKDTSSHFTGECPGGEMLTRILIKHQKGIC